MHCKMFISRLTNTSFTSHNYHFVVVMRTFKICFLSNFQAYNILLETIATMLHITTSELYSSYNEKFTFNQYPHFSQLQPLAAKHSILYFLMISNLLLDDTCKGSHTVFAFVWIISLSLMPSGLHLHSHK